MPYIAKNPYIDNSVKTEVQGENAAAVNIAKFTIPEPVVADADGILEAMASTTIAVSATCVVEADSAETDILTVTAPAALGATANALKILLTTAADDVLAVTKTDGTSTINIALADSTAANNTAALIQVAIRALATVGGVDVSDFACAAGGNWDTAAIATGETAAVAFTGGVTAVADVITEDIGELDVPRTLTATAGGTAGDIKAVQVIVEGTDINGDALTETLPIFTVNTAGAVAGVKAFKTITKITIPAHDGAAATTAVGFADKFGIPYKLPYSTLVMAKLNGVVDTGTITADAADVSKNLFNINGTPDGEKDVDLYLFV